MKDVDKTYRGIALPSGDATSRRHWTRDALGMAVLGIAGCNGNGPVTEETAPPTGPTGPEASSSSGAPGIALHVLRFKVKKEDSGLCLQVVPPKGLRICKRRAENGSADLHIAVFRMLDTADAVPLTVEQAPDSLGTIHALSSVFSSYPPEFDMATKPVLSVDHPLVFVVNDTIGIDKRCMPNGDENVTYARGMHFQYTDSNGASVSHHCETDPDHTEIHVEC